MSLSDDAKHTARHSTTHDATSQSDRYGLVRLLLLIVIVLGLVVFGGSVYFAARQKTNMGRTYSDTSTVASHATPQSTTTSSESFGAVPSSGSSPLSVTFTGTARGSYTLDFGDGTPPFKVLVFFECSNGGACVPPPGAVNDNYTYAFAGVYTAVLKDQVGTRAVTVTVH